MDKENKPLYKRIIVITNTLLLILFAGVLQLIYPVSQARGEWKLVGTIYGDDLIGPLNQPSGIFFDEEKQRVYLADTRNNRLLSYGSNFEFLSEFSAEGKLELPTCIVRDSKKRLIVTESKKNQITIIDIMGKKIYPLDFSHAPQGGDVIPGNLALDGEDNLYVIDRAGGKILVFDNQGKYLRAIKTEGGLGGFNDVRVGVKGNVYALDTLQGKVYVFDKKGKLLFQFGKRGEKRREFEFPVSLAVDRRGLIYVVDQHKNMVLIFNGDGEFQGEFSEFGWREGMLNFPSYIFIDRSQRIYVVDRDNDRVQIFKRL